MFLRELLCIQNKECLLSVLSDKSWAKRETDDETKQYQSIMVWLYIPDFNKFGVFQVSGSLEHQSTLF